MACRCFTQLIEPDSASTTCTALRTAPAVMMSRGFTSCHTISTIRAPAACRCASILGLPAATGALPGSAMPSDSHTMCMEFAVPMPAQTPGLCTATSAMPLSSSSVIPPDAM